MSEHLKPFGLDSVQRLQPLVLVRLFNLPSSAVAHVYPRRTSHHLSLRPKFIKCNAIKANRQIITESESFNAPHLTLLAGDIVSRLVMASCLQNDTSAYGSWTVAIAGTPLFDDVRYEFHIMQPGPCKELLPLSHSRSRASRSPRLRLSESTPPMSQLLDAS